MSRLPVPLAALVLLAGCARPPEPTTPAVPTPSPPRSPARAVVDGVAFLIKQQSPDGAWRSDVYATFKDGPALTPLVVCALQEAAAAGATEPDTTAARKKGSDYLAKLVRADGTIEGGDSGLDYPAYTAALAVKALSHQENAGHAKARDAWVKYLLARQLTEPLGWKPEDKQYGGWGYCRLLPKKPEPNTVAPPLIESNLSATVFALEALRAAGVADPDVYAKALAFVSRMQNVEVSIGCSLIPPGLDGGFHFIYDDPVRNKAGVAGPADQSPVRFHSYGSTTADGLRALVACGVPADDHRLVAARFWLVEHFRPDTHPGKYVEAHERNREAVYFYYAASAAKALRAAGVKEAGGTPWAGALAAELAGRQRADGSWANPVELVRENDPVVATATAVIALANCPAAP